MNRVVLLSGGLDSAVCLAGLPADTHDAVAVAVDYGQPHAEPELGAAARVAAAYGVDLIVFRVELGARWRPDDPAMIVPGRNLALLALANVVREARSFDTVVIGCNADDAENYVDCRREFIEAVRAIFPVEAPLLTATKTEVGRLALELGVPVDLTWSCYYPREDRLPCGECDACKARDRALAAGKAP